MTTRPPLLSSSRLPLPLTPIVGRLREIDAVRQLVRQADGRLVTLTGPAGVGKTRLALEVAAGIERGAEYADGVAHVALGAVHDPSLVSLAIASALGVPQDAGQAIEVSLAFALRTREQLILLDNFEHVIEAAPLLAPILANCPGISLLVTSRERLRLSGEREYPVSTLELPASVHEETLTGVTNSDAVMLFVARAQAVTPDFVLTDANAPTVAEICRRLDGLPLAIELAAARVKVLPLDPLLARLKRRLPLLTGGGRDKPERLRSMRDAIAWSYDILSPVEQALCRRLAVFVGGFTLDAAERVGSGVLQDRETGVGSTDVLSPDSRLPSPVFEGVSSLVEKSLVRQVANADDSERFGMLETVREFAFERLSAAAEEDAIRRRHGVWALALAERADAALTGPDQVDWLHELEAEHDNLRAALGWSIEAGELEIALRLVGALWRFWAYRGYHTEGRMWAERALDAPGDAPPAVRAKALHHLGNLAIDLGDPRLARRHYEAGYAIRRALGDPAAVANSLNGLGLAAYYEGRYDEAERLHEESHAIRRELGDRAGIATSLSNLGDVATAIGDFTRSKELQSSALAMRLSLGDANAAAYSTFNLGEVAAAEGSIDEARELFEQSQAAFREVGDNLGVAYTRCELGRLALRQGEVDQATSLLGEALAIRHELGDRLGVAECLEGLAGIAVAVRQPIAGVELYAAASALRETQGIPIRPFVRDRHEREVERARATLRSEATAAAWANGRGLTMDAASERAQALAAEIAGASRSIESTSPEDDEVLSAREREVLHLIAAGNSNRDIAEMLFIAKRTVDTHSSNILKKLDLSSRAEAVAYAYRHGIA